MKHYTATDLLIRANPPDADLIVRVTPEQAGWSLLTFEARRLRPGVTYAVDNGARECALVVLSGTINVRANVGEWLHIGQRRSVFEGGPFALYLPIESEFEVTAETPAEIALGWAPADQEHPPQLVRPEDVQVEIRGGDQATRHINTIIPPGFACQRLVVVEVYTPGGNWSSYPPHKHDVHRVDENGNVIEADLEEIYFYKFDRPEGFAFQRIYTDDRSPLHRAGYPIDAALTPHHNDVVIVPEGYHPVASPPGYTTYYLNVLAGSAQSLANAEDPRYAWVKDTYRAKDPRLPLYALP
ncbi:MAG: 5-deoxy-glucuronate isomerase [Anaerolineae bacterium]|nr:5-deoxy-glucuronate isomerase [Anaerolineae bacterium]